MNIETYANPLMSQIQMLNTKALPSWNPSIAFGPFGLLGNSLFLYSKITGNWFKAEIEIFTLENMKLLWKIYILSPKKEEKWQNQCWCSLFFVCLKTLLWINQMPSSFKPITGIGVYLTKLNFHFIFSKSRRLFF